MSRRHWLPAVIRRKPDRLIHFSYQVSEEAAPADAGDLISSLCATHGISLIDSTNDEWDLLVNDTTRVFGLVPREVEEVISVQLVPWSGGFAIDIDCEPTETHTAHLVGAAGVLVFAGSVWIAGGPADGILPALATTIAGWLVVEVTRHWALDALEHRVRRLAKAFGRALWPNQTGQLI